MRQLDNHRTLQQPADINHLAILATTLVLFLFLSRHIYVSFFSGKGLVSYYLSTPAWRLQLNAFPALCLYSYQAS